MATVITAPEADRQLEAIDDWWRTNRSAARISSSKSFAMS
jgi:hypothetical protein